MAHIRFIKRAQKLGFTLREIKDLLSLRAAPEVGADIRQKTREKISEIDRKIADLTRIRQKPVELIEACAEHGSTDECLVLHAFEAR